MSEVERRGSVGEKGKNEMDVEGQGDGERGDVTHPRMRRDISR